MSAQPSAAAFNANIFDNSTAYHNRLSRFRQYTAVAAVIGAHGWFAEGGAQVLREREIGVPDPAAPDTEYAYLIITGRARPNKCFVGPTGSYNPKFGDPLSKAKYGFVLECPDDDVVLKAAWNSSMDHLKIIEKDVCPGNSLYFFDDTNGVKGVRFTKPVFEKKSDVPPLTDTARWPVGSQNLERLKETAVTHDVQPFPLYNEQGHLVPPTEVERALPGCLVQVTFTLTYHSFPREGRIVESLSGKVVQALVLRKGRAKPPTPYNGRGIYMPAPSLELPGASTPNPPVLSQSPSTPVRFATHLQPETSPYGAHPFVFAHPAGGQGFAPAAAELHTVPAVRHAQPPNPPATPPPFGAHLTPETSPYGSHPFVFAHTVSPGIHPPLFGVSHPSNRPLGSVSSPASLPTTPLRNGTHPPLFGPNFHHSPTSTPPRPITPRHMGTHPPLFPYTPPTPTPIGTRVTHPLLTPAPPQVAQGGTHPPLFGPPLRYDAPRRPSTPLFLPGTPSPVENRNAQSNSASRVASSRPEERSPFIAAFVERPLHGSNAAAASWESPDGYHGAAERSPGFVPAGVSPFGQGGNIGSIPHIVRPTTPAQPPGISAFAHSGVLRAATNSPGYFPQSPSVARGAIHPAAGTFLPLEASPFPATFGGPAHAMGLYPETPGRT
ncbi:hypothetical protein C8R44DRAFT_888418 [Mycena epipterygia]|nr:hypothetical protein C8R44DRAFT_888418 [Mycena epipterygia]